MRGFANACADDLSPTARGKGIVPAAVRTLLEFFLIPHMNVYHLTAAFLDFNIASRRVCHSRTIFFLIIKLAEIIIGARKEWVCT